ncbi:hypothetical protein EDB85DRAFT_1885471 [Lactarius pseudohatsudake]|nr:hypothetical protein EDB85DRAFT_1885471 [Lactarius pseudohatsudake]
MCMVRRRQPPRLDSHQRQHQTSFGLPRAKPPHPEYACAWSTDANPRVWILTNADTKHLSGYHERSMHVHGPPTPTPASGFSPTPTPNIFGATTSEVRRNNSPFPDLLGAAFTPRVCIVRRCQPPHLNTHQHLRATTSEASSGPQQSTRFRTTFLPTSSTDSTPSLNSLAFRTAKQDGKTERNASSKLGWVGHAGRFVVTGAWCGETQVLVINFRAGSGFGRV